MLVLWQRAALNFGRKMLRLFLDVGSRGASWREDPFCSEAPGARETLAGVED